MSWRFVATVVSAFVCLSLVSAEPSVQELQRQIEELRRLVLEQQKEIERLKGQVKQSQPAQPTVTASSGENLSFYGFLRLDSLMDSGLMNNAQIPFWVQSPSNTNKRRTGNQQLTIHPRLSRLGINFTAPPNLLWDWQVTGKFEVDWLVHVSDVAESRQLPRVRLFYLQLQRGDYALRLGQDWDIIAPLNPSPDDHAVLWNAGNLGDRRAQVRLTYAPKNKPFSWTLGLGLTGALDSKDLDKNGVRDGEDSGLPNVQLRLAWKSRQVSLGLWGHYAWERTTNPVGNQRRFFSHSLGLDWQWYLGPRWDLRGEAWIGRNLSDFRGGIAQGVNTTTGSEIHSKGGWLEIGYQVSPKHRMAIGYALDDPNNAHVPSGGRTKNEVWYLHNRWQLANNVAFVVNYLFWTTNWKGQATGINHRIATFIQHNF